MKMSFWMAGLKWGQVELSLVSLRLAVHEQMIFEWPVQLEDVFETRYITRMKAKSKPYYSIGIIPNAINLVIYIDQFKIAQPSLDYYVLPQEALLLPI